MKYLFALLALLPALAFADGMGTLTGTSTAVGTGTSTAGANNAGNAQNLSLNSYGPGHQQFLTTPSVQGNAFYGSVSPDGCTVSQGGGASGWLAGFSFVGAHDAVECYGLRAFERTMQWVVNLPPEGDAAHGLPSRAEGMLIASDELCELSDRQKAIMEAHGLCRAVHDIPTLEHTGFFDGSSRSFDRKFNEDHPNL